MAQGMDVSEKRDLWVPAALLLAGIGVLVLDVAQGRTLFGVLAGVVGFLGAVACLPLRMKRSQRRVEAFGLGVALLLVALAPGMAPSPATALAWIVLALAFLAPLPHLPQRMRAGLLLAAALFALLGVLAAADLGIPKALIWLCLAAAFHLAAQVWSSRPSVAPEAPPGARVCLMGGSFDPFHRGHRALAEAALRVVDRLLVVPAGVAPHKRGGRAPTEFHHRVAMARLGVEGLARTEVLELEGRRPGPSFTIDTLDVVKTSHPPGTRFLLLVGADMFQDLPNWKDWERIVATVTILVAARPGWDLEAPPEFEGRNVVTEHLVAPEIEVSSTELRQAIFEGEAVGDRMSPAVYAYVRDHELYAPDAKGEGS